MLQRLRTSGSARAFLLAAGLLVVSASFGLHPEPAADRASPGALPSWAAKVSLAGASHECPACLTHRPVSLARPAVVVLRAESLVTLAAAPAVRIAERIDFRPRQPRAPPAAS